MHPSGPLVAPSVRPSTGSAISGPS